MEFYLELTIVIRDDVGVGNIWDYGEQDDRVAGFAFVFFEQYDDVQWVVKSLV
ncbi:MAG: hypothetical protein HC892_21750 [Saprospiraceae bacterium]|nr:hypothetical protein [Saprospiraceae bacterium]